MSYTLRFTPSALEDIAFHKKTGNKIICKKIEVFLKELVEHPTTGTGHPEPLRYGRSGQWSRKITDKHRIVYEIFETEITVEILSAKDHYNDK